MVFDKIRQAETLPLFLLKSILFVNQIGLIHILPTFIPLLLLSPLILYSFSRNYTGIVILCSIFLFVIGNRFPYAFNFGEKTIFPVILWQIYFVAGCVLGKEAYQRKKIGPDNINNYLYVAILVFGAAMFIKHAKVIPPTLISKFPLNALGVFYGGAILLLLYTFTLKYWHVLKKIKLFNNYVTLFGRHSLLTFFIHVYTVYFIVLVNKYYVNIYFNYCLILLSIVIIYKIIYIHEHKEKKNTIFLGLGKLFR